MKARGLTIPEIVLIGGTRVALGAGIGFLLSGRLNKDQRNAAGWSLQAKTQQLYPDTGKFSALISGRQIKTLTEIEKTPFFNMVRTHTVIGFLARPVHGGNYEKIGWKLIGYDDSLNHKPPFGYYDTQPPMPPSGVQEKLP